MSSKAQLLFVACFPANVLEISKIKNKHKGNHSRFTLDKNPNVWLTVKLYKISGSPKARIERTHRKSKNEEVGERWMEQREIQRKDMDGKNKKGERRKVRVIIYKMKTEKMRYNKSKS